MMELLQAASEFTVEGVPVFQLTPWGVILLMVVGFMRGWVVPRQAVEDEREDTERWRIAHENSEKARVVTMEQMRELLDQLRTEP